MLNFYDVPKKGPKAALGLGLGANSFNGAMGDIETVWKPWFKKNKTLAPPDWINVSLNDVAAVLATEEKKGGMPFWAARRYVSTYLSEIGASGDIVVRKWMHRLPPSHRRAADEVLAVALSVAVAWTKGYHFVASRQEINDMLPHGGALWRNRWEGFGPDYVMDTGFGHIAFLEVKGRVGSCKHPPTDFYKHKAQSLNATILGKESRHILSIAHLPADGFSPMNAEVQWFNASEQFGHHEATEPTSEHKFLSLVIAACQFKTQLRIAGHTMDILDDKADGSALGFERTKKYWIEKKKGNGPRLVIGNRAWICFKKIMELLHTADGEGPLRMLAEMDLDGHLFRLKSLRKSAAKKLDKDLTGYKVLYRYSTGIHVVAGSRSRD